MTTEAEMMEDSKDLVTCGRCGGEGSETYDEDDGSLTGRRVTDPCYHCAGSGKVSSETAFHDRVAAAASVLASRWVRELRKSVENDEFDFGLCSAENGLSASDYARELVFAKTEEFGRELAGLSHHLQVALVDELVPEDEEPVAVPSSPATLTVPVFDGGLTDDEVPF